MLNEIMQNLQTVDTNTLSQTALSSIASSMGSMVSSLIPIILDIIILALMRCPLYGLRFIPVYGKYYFYKSLVPHKKGLAIARILISIIELILGTALLIYLLICLFSSIAGYDADMSTLFMCCNGYIFLWLASFIITLLLNFSLAERFEYDKLLGILFTIIPIVGTICMIAKAKSVAPITAAPTQNYQMYDNMDGYTDAQQYVDAQSYENPQPYNEEPPLMDDNAN